MECDCGKQAVYEDLCEEHFTASFEEKVRRTIAEFGLVMPGERIAVAVSGGKDSLTILTLLHAWYGDVTAIAIDEGIAGYRDRTLEDVRAVCRERGIPLVIRSFKELTGKTLDEMVDSRSLPCTVCGALRRKLLAQAAQGFDVIATGHNADDEAQAVLMNIIRGNTELFNRIGPVSGAEPESAGGFTRRIKPLYFCTEKEVMTYAFLKGLVRDFNECPNISGSYRHIVRDGLNGYAQSHPGVKERLLRRFLVAKRAHPKAAGMLRRCAACGQPSSGERCKACIVAA